MFNKVSDNFRDRYEFARTHIKRETIILQIALICIMAVAILIRFMPAFKYTWTLTASDTYSQLIAARTIDSQINSHGFLGSLLSFLTYVDPSMWYPNSGVRDFGTTQNLGTPLTAVIVRRVFLLFGINFSITQAAFIAPAFCGSLTVLVAYYLGKEVANKRVGLFSAFFLSVSPGHLQTSIAGYFDSEAVGLLLMLLTFYLFLKALRTGSLPISFFSGLSLAGLLLSWSGATYAIQLISLYAVILILTNKYSERLLTAYSVTVLTALSFAVLYPTSGPSILLGINGLIPLAVLGLLIAISFYTYHKETFDKIPFLTVNNLVYAGYALILGAIAFIIINFIVPIVPTFRTKFITIIVPFFRNSSPLTQSVAEQIINAWGTMFKQLFLLEFFIPIAIIYFYKKPTENNIFMLLYLFTALYFSGSMVRLILILAPAAAIGAAKAVDEILLPFAMVRQEKFFLSKRKRTVSVSIGQEHVSIAFIVIFSVLALNFLQGVTIAGQIIKPASIDIPVYQGAGHYSLNDDWYQAFDWIGRDSPTSSVIASWWNYGYWLTLANRTTIADGATLNSTQIGNLGALLMSSPDVALKIASYYDVNYIVVLTAAGLTNIPNDLSNMQWMVKIAQSSGTLDKSLGAPINSKFYLKTDSSGVVSYVNATFKSLIWALMTDASYSNSQIQSSFKGDSMVANSKDLTVGFTPGYELYRQIFKEAFMSSNGIVNVIQIDWNAAARLVGVNT